MTASEIIHRPPVQSTFSPPRQGAVRRWSWSHVLALIGVPILILNAWTVIAWLADGPTQMTEFRDPGSFNWYVARAVEGTAIVGSIFMIVYLVRGCRRAGRILTFEVMFCIAGATIFWADFGMNVFQPIFVASSNFVNLNNTCGHMPFVVNPDCGQAPDPILFLLLLEAFIFLGCAIAVSRLAAKVRSRWSGLSTAQLFAVVMALGFAFALTEMLVLALGIWGYAGPRWMAFSPGHGLHYHLVIWLGTGMALGFYSALYFFRNDRGETIVERGLEHYSPRWRKAIAMMALYSIIQIISWGPGTTPMIVMSFFQDGWAAEMPPYLVNGMCDRPGIEGTRYGPCPGSPGYRMPGRHSLPGESP
jgi:hypothetical protein